MAILQKPEQDPTWGTPTNERLLLSARLPSLAVQIERSRQSLEKFAQINPDLYQRVSARLAAILEQRSRELKLLYDKIQRAPADECWKDYTLLQEECRLLFRETFAFMEGALLRTAGIDDGLCLLADGLLDELDAAADIKWQRMCIPAESDFFGDEAQIIRLRFPEIDIWNLPVAVHEFGHFVGPEICVTITEQRRRRQVFPFQEILDREMIRGYKWWSFAHEQFADMFATYSLGPAYACACVFGRFDPKTAHDDRGPRHPSGAKRVELMIRTLQEMNQEAGVASPYAGVISELRESWQAMLAAGQQNVNLDDAAATELEQVFPEFYLLLAKHMQVLRYSGMTMAQRLKSPLADGHLPQPGGDITIADVVNAAWLSRIDHWGEGSAVVATIADSASRLCRRVLERRVAEAH